jgi:probable O-glycosylation ligase (exosortase A-associated)
MPTKSELLDYEPVTPSPRAGRAQLVEAPDDTARIRPFPRPALNAISQKLPAPQPTVGRDISLQKAQPSVIPVSILRRGHALSYAGIFTFTFLVYFRPYELFPSLAWLSRSALVVAALTLMAFVPAQLGLENRITAKLREVKLAVALLFAGALSIPLAIEPGRAFQSLIEFSKVIVMFIVMVNVVRTEQRLQRLLLLVLSVSCLLSISAVSDYLQGNLVMRGQRIAGLIGGLFSNPNDLALHLVTMIPISFALLLGSRGGTRKIAFLCCSLLLTAGLVATFSRGGFIGFVCVVGILVWKLAKRNRFIFAPLALILLTLALAIAPGDYRQRLTTTGDDSAITRTDDLKRSIAVAARHPVFGVGMDNYVIYSNTAHATHNSYTQVAAEMGLLAFVVYLGFLVSPFKGLHKIEQAMRTATRKPRAYYLAIGLQASIVGYMVVSFFASVAFVWYVYYLVAYAICLQRLTPIDPTFKLQPVDNK